MRLSATLLIFAAAFVTTIANGVGKCPAWVPLALLSIGGLLLSGVPAR